MTKHKNKKLDGNLKGTLDQKHVEYINKFDNMCSSLSDKKNRLTYIKKNLYDLQTMNSNKYTSDEITTKSKLLDEIEDLTSEIKKIENDTDQLNYISNTLPILINYYGNNNFVEDGMEEFIDSTTNGKKNVLSYLLANKPEIIDTVKIVPKTNCNKTKVQLYGDYLTMTDHSYQKKSKNIVYICKDSDCNGTLLVSDGILVCDKCGASESYFTQYSKPNYKEPLQDSGTYAYKRINHLTEILSQLQAKETTDIPQKVYESISKEIIKRNISVYDLDIFKLRRILKKLNFRKYYEHVPHILQNINGKEPPNFSRIDEAKIKKMFKDIQKPFAIYCPKNRKNFLNYSYVLHKFCELLELDDYIEYFPLLKNNNKLIQHDKIWRNICGYMKWKFYLSI